MPVWNYGRNTNEHSNHLLAIEEKDNEYGIFPSIQKDIHFQLSRAAKEGIYMFNEP